MKKQKTILILSIIMILTVALAAIFYVMKPRVVGNVEIRGKDYPLIERKNPDSNVFKYEPIYLK